MEAKEFGRNLLRSQYHCPTRFAAQRLATTVKRFGALNSVVERLVYTDTQLIFSLYPNSL
jgi:hypothetical protein